MRAVQTAFADMDRVVPAVPEKTAEKPPVRVTVLLPATLVAERVPRVDVVADIRAASPADGCEKINIEQQMEVVRLRLVQVVEVGRKEADPSSPKPQNRRLTKDKVCAFAVKAVGLSEKPLGAPAKTERRAVTEPRPHKTAVGRDSSTQADKRVTPPVRQRPVPKLMALDGRRQTAALPV